MPACVVYQVCQKLADLLNALALLTRVGVQFAIIVIGLTAIHRAVLISTDAAVEQIVGCFGIHNS